VVRHSEFDFAGTAKCLDEDGLTPVSFAGVFDCIVASLDERQIAIDQIRLGAALCGEETMEGPGGLAYLGEIAGQCQPDCSGR
jgi:hypothetical protein